MTKKILLINKNDLNKTIEIQRYEFIIWMLESIGVSQEDLLNCFPEDVEEFDISCRLRLKKLSDKYHFDLVEDPNGEVRIYIQNTLVGEWKKPWTILRKDPSQSIRSKRLYMEVHLSWFTSFGE